MATKKTTKKASSEKLFEGYERREAKILAALKPYGIKTIEECRDICLKAGFDRSASRTPSGPTLWARRWRSRRAA